MNNESLPEQLILASSSKYRIILLQRLGIPFTCQSPEIDETSHNGESPSGLVERLAAGKAETASHKHPRAVVIGSDQLAVFNGRSGGFLREGKGTIHGRLDDVVEGTR